MTRIIKRLSAAERARFIAAARSYITAGPDGESVPFKHRGRSVRGVDCLGLVVVAMAEAGRTMRDKAVYGRDPSNDGIREAAVAHFGQPIELANVRPGDVLLMQWHGQPNHVGIVGDYVLGGLSLIHSLAQEKRVVEHRLADPWPRRVTEAFRP